MTELGHTISQEDESGIRALVGQLFIIGFHGTVPSDDIQTLIRKYKVGAVRLIPCLSLKYFKSLTLRKMLSQRALSNCLAALK